MKRKCTATTIAGRPCQAWAIRESDPPRCPAHAGPDRGASSLRQQTEEDSFYRRQLSNQELADLVAYSGDGGLGDEIAINRVMLRRLLNSLGDTEDASLSDVVKVATLVFRGTKAVAALLRDERALSGEAADGIAGAIAQALDELSTELGLEL